MMLTHYCAKMDCLSTLLVAYILSKSTICDKIHSLKKPMFAGIVISKI